MYVLHHIEKLTFYYSKRELSYRNIKMHHQHSIDADIVIIT